MGELDKQNFWDVGAIKWKDIPTLQEVLQAADRKVLINLLCEDYFTKRRYELKNLSKDEAKLYRKRARKQYAKVLKQMCNLKVKPSKEWITFPETTLAHQLSGKKFKITTEATIVKRSALAEVAKNFGDIFQGGEMVLPDCVRGYSLTLDPWETLLGSRVWLKGCRSRKERYLFLVAVIWQMTFFGFDYKSQKIKAKKEADTLESGCIECEAKLYKAYPCEIVFQRMYREDPDSFAPNYGLHEEHDSFDEEYDLAVMHRAMELRRFSKLDLCRRMAELQHMLDKGYWHEPDGASGGEEDAAEKEVRAKKGKKTANKKPANKQAKGKKRAGKKTGGERTESVSSTTES